MLVSHSSFPASINRKVRIGAIKHGGTSIR